MDNIFRPISREQKIVDRVYPFFGEVAKFHNSDLRVLEICKELIGTDRDALKSEHIAPLLDIWQRDCPEENDLREFELQWALRSLESSLSKQLRDIHGELPGDRKKVQLRVIRGGLADTPKRDVSKLFEEA
jgi:hypothetical protein